MQVFRSKTLMGGHANYLWWNIGNDSSLEREICCSIFPKKQTANGLIRFSDIAIIYNNTCDCWDGIGKWFVGCGGTVLRMCLRWRCWLISIFEFWVITCLTYRPHKMMLHVQKREGERERESMYRITSLRKIAGFHDDACETPTLCFVNYWRWFEVSQLIDWQLI